MADNSEYNLGFDNGFAVGQATAQAQAAAQEQRIAELEAENARVRVTLAGIANRINVVGSPWHDAQIALDRIVIEVKKEARATLGEQQ